MKLSKPVTLEGIFDTDTGRLVAIQQVGAPGDRSTSTPVLSEYDPLSGGLKILAPVAQVGVEHTIAIVGDSTCLDGYIQGESGVSNIKDNITWWASAYSKGALRVGTTCAIGGWTTDNVDANWAARIAARKPSFLVFGIGLNNIHSATDAAAPAVELALREWLKTRVKEVMSWGTIPVVMTMMPVGNAYSSSTKRTLHFAHNQWRRQFAASLGLPLLDAESLAVDPTSATGDPYAAYFQQNGSPHGGKEIIRELGYQLWKLIERYVPAPITTQQSNRFTSHMLFNNPALTGTGGNLNGGSGVLPDSTFGWETNTDTAYSVEASTDSKLSFAGAPVKSNWLKVVTNTASIASPANGTPVSDTHPGVLFFTSGLTPSPGTYSATCEIEIITPKNLLGFDCQMRTNNNDVNMYHPQAISAFSPVVTATDNTKNNLLTPTVFQLPRIDIVIQEGQTYDGIWLAVNARYSNTGTGNCVWRVRNPQIWKQG